MRLSPVLLACVLSLATATALGGEAGKSRTLEVINRAHASLTAVAVKPADAGEFRDIPLAVPVQGGGNSTTLALREGGCRYDLRLQFRDGRAVIYKDVDVCRLQSLRIDPLQRNERGLRLAAD